MIQVDLFGPGARATDPNTSHEAADRVRPRAATDRGRVLLVHAKYLSGLTDFELAERMDRQQTSVGKRRGELRDAGFIEATKDLRPAPSGSRAIVWRITRDGLNLIAEMKRDAP